MSFSRRLATILVGCSLGGAGVVACLGDDPLPSDAASDVDDASTVDPNRDATVPPTGDTGTGTDPDAGADAAPPTFCDTQTAPAGVTDFLCADFDGPVVNEAFTSTYIPDGGSLDRSSEYVSPPSSFANSKNAQMFWSKGGAKPFAEIDLRFQLRIASLGGVTPSSSEFVTIIELGGTDGKLAIKYSKGGTINGSTYTGYLLDATNCPDACANSKKPIPISPKSGVWQDVHLVWKKTGEVELTFDSGTPFKTNMLSLTSTTASLTMGLLVFSNFPLVGAHQFDNVIVSVKRDL